MRAAVIGFGNVGRAVVRESSRGYGPPIRFVAAASSRGAVVIRSRGDEEALLKLGEVGERLDSHPTFVEGLGAIDAVSESGAELAFIAIPPSYERGEPNESIVKALLEQGISVVTADKTVLARGIMEAHGGQVWVESEGCDHERCPGSKFHVTIPLATSVTD